MGGHVTRVAAGRLWLAAGAIGALGLLLGSFSACAAGSQAATGAGGGLTAGQGGGNTTTGSHGGAGGGGGAGGAATGSLTLCVLGDGGPEDPCLNPAKLVYGDVSAGAQEMRLFRIDDSTDKSVTFDAVTIASNAFATKAVVYKKDPQHAGKFIRTVETLPVTRAPGESLWFEVTFSAGTTPGPLPANKVTVSEKVGTDPEKTTVPMTGDVQGCPPGTVTCDPSGDGCETKIDTDPDHCGGCGNACHGAHETPACVGGMCEIGACDAGYGDCDFDPDNGCESNFINDPCHCGDCDTDCHKAHTDAFCNGGNCNIQGCDQGYADCNLDASDGCETDVGTDMNNCGGCNLKCDFSHASETCTNGQCVFGACDPGYADCDHDPSNGCEAKLDSDGGNCGMCGTACNLPHATSSCSSGTCKIDTCDTNYADCDGDAANGCEIKIDTNLNHCGGCDVVCDFANANQVCLGGVCVLDTCQHGFADCNNDTSNGCEVNILTTHDDCGGCGNVCNVSNATSNCVNGTCEMGTCNIGFADCDHDASNGCEANLKTSLDDCGTCGTVCNFPDAQESCNNGVCVMGACFPGFANCNGNPADGCETNTQTSMGNCGGCGKVCDYAHASEQCLAGTCVLGACDPGFANCDGNTANGCETDTSSNTANCGSCGHTCSFPNASASCSSGTCQMGACNVGFADCDGDPSNGCEVNIKTSLGNCGGCGSVCDYPNASETCTNGVCLLGTCDAGFANCDGIVSNGCEVDTGSSLANCGGCGHLCDYPNASEQCLAGTCVLGACDAGFANCDGIAANGCEVNTNTSLANCGGCNQVCNLPHASDSCVNGVCTLNSCNTGFADCDSNPANGCETNTNTNLANCGGCGSVCALPNAVTACAGGACLLSACNPGWGDCNGNPADGCETNTATSLGNCGGCGVTCALANASESCVGGSCILGACDAGFANCDGNSANGCETNINTSLTDCGGCGISCNLANSSESCVAGTCTLGTCDPGFANCNGVASDGCEVNTQTDVANCGGCGTQCANVYPNSSVSCTTGTCNFLGCLAGHYNLDGNLANGCEYACTFIGALDNPDDSFVDRNCDGIDGDVTKAIFVAIPADGGNDGNAGTMTAPMATINAAIAKAGSVGKTQVYISEGTYNGRVTLADGISLYGGYSKANGWARSASYIAKITSSAVSGSPARVSAVEGTTITTATTIDRLTIQTGNTATAGVSNYALYCSGCTGLTIKNSVLDAGRRGLRHGGRVRRSAGGRRGRGTQRQPRLVRQRQRPGGAGGSMTCSRHERERRQRRTGRTRGRQQRQAPAAPGRTAAATAAAAARPATAASSVAGARRAPAATARARAPRRPGPTAPAPAAAA